MTKESVQNPAIVRGFTEAQVKRLIDWWLDRKKSHVIATVSEGCVFVTLPVTSQEWVKMIPNTSPVSLRDDVAVNLIMEYGFILPVNLPMEHILYDFRGDALPRAVKKPIEKEPPRSTESDQSCTPTLVETSTEEELHSDEHSQRCNPTLVEDAEGIYDRLDRLESALGLMFSVLKDTVSLQKEMLDLIRGRQ